MGRHDRAAGGLNGPRRRARRARSLLVGGLAAVLVWSSLAFLQSAATVATDVQVVPGTGTDGIGDVVPLGGTITRPSGKAQLQAGVKFARIDVAETFHDDMRVTVAWQNAPEFRRDTRIGGWQLRFGLYYPVRASACIDIGGSADPPHAVTVELDAGEGFGSAPETYCAYRDLAASGPGVVPSGDHRGTQLIAAERLVATFSPTHDQTAAVACAGSGTLPCRPTSMSGDQRAWFVIGSLLNPGGSAPPAQQDDISGLEIFTRIAKGGI